MEIELYKTKKTIAWVIFILATICVLGSLLCWFGFYRAVSPKGWSGFVKAINTNTKLFVGFSFLGFCWLLLSIVSLVKLSHIRMLWGGSFGSMMIHFMFFLESCGFILLIVFLFF